MNARATQSLVSSAVDIKIDFAKFRESVAGLPPTNFHYRSQGRWQFEWDEGGEVEVSNLDGVIKDLGPLQADGYGVVLYIKDHGSRIDEVIDDPAEGRKVHLAYCKTLEHMEKSQKFERYRLKREPNGQFLISGLSNQTEILEQEVPLSVCKNCLKQLNYRGYRDLSFIGDARDLATRDFDYEAFFENYSSFFPKLPSKDEKSPVDYASGQREVFTVARKRAGNCCEKCGVDLTTLPSLLHTHCSGGVEDEKSADNLRVLCANCLRRQPNHDPVYLSRRDDQVLHEARKRQDSSSLIELPIEDLIDTAWKEPLKIFQKRYGGRVEPYLDLADANNTVICNLTLAFMDRKVGLLPRYSDEESKRAREVGWRLYTHDEAMAH